MTEYEKAGKVLRQIFIDHSHDPESRWAKMPHEQFWAEAVRHCLERTAFKTVEDATRTARNIVETDVENLRLKLSHLEYALREAMELNALLWAACDKHGIKPSQESGVDGWELRRAA